MKAEKMKVRLNSAILFINNKAFEVKLYNGKLAVTSVFQQSSAKERRQAVRVFRVLCKSARETFE
jgi:hypothetical protein